MSAQTTLPTGSAWVYADLGPGQVSVAHSPNTEAPCDTCFAPATYIATVRVNQTAVIVHLCEADATKALTTKGGLSTMSATLLTHTVHGQTFFFQADDYQVLVDHDDLELTAIIDTSEEAISIDLLLAGRDAIRLAQTLATTKIDLDHPTAFPIVVNDAYVFWTDGSLVWTSKAWESVVETDEPIEQVGLTDVIILRGETVAICGICGREWIDSIPTAVTPTPSARCPFEYDHEEN
jgi:hypothetical protein